MFLCRRLPACVTRFPSLRSGLSSNAHIPSRPPSQTPKEKPAAHSNLSHVVVPGTGVLSRTPLKTHDAQAAANVSILRQFKTLRRKNGLATFPAGSWIDVFNTALESRSHQMVDHLINEIGSYPGDESERRKFLWTILLGARLNILEKESLRASLEYLSRSPADTQGSSLEAFTRVLTWAVDNPLALAYENTSELILRLLLPFLQQFPAHQDNFVFPSTPPPMIQSTITFLQYILQQPNLQEGALEIFGALVNSSYIPAETLPESDGSITFDSVVFPALTRTCLHYGWVPLASSYLLDFIEQKTAPPRLCADLAAETIRSLLEDANPAELDVCSRLICLTNPAYPIPNRLVYRFYHRAREAGHGQAAEMVYAYSREPGVLQAHRYPSPQGLELSWFVHYLAKHSESVHLCRRLAEEVIEFNLSIPIQYAARFISTIASLGHSTLTRTLWERFVTSEDGNIVAGDPGLLIAMCRLFLSLMRRIEDDLAEMGESHLPHDKISLQTKLEGVSTFLDRLLLEFRAQHEPLAEAEHHILTTFARACFIVGNFGDGFRAFQYLLDRKEIPDRYDVNVALTAIAKHCPRAACQFVDSMIKRNIQPDDSTYCTVMNAALAHKDFDLVDAMSNHVLAMHEDGEITVKSMMGLIHATATPRPGEDLSAQRSRLRRTMKLIQSWTGTLSGSSPQVGRELVLASVRADDPEMAYRFWKLLLRHSTEWDDGDQIYLRSLISRQIRNSGWLRSELAHSILSQLRLPPEVPSGPPHPVSVTQR